MIAVRSRVLIGVCISALLCTGAYAGGYYTSNTRTVAAGTWDSYTGGASGLGFSAGWGSNGADRILWYTTPAQSGVARDMYLEFKHWFQMRSNGDPAAEHWSWAEGVSSGTSINQNNATPTNTEVSVNTRACYNWDDGLEIGSDGGGTSMTIADQARFYPVLDAVYAGKSVVSDMYLGNVYQWSYSMTNPASAWWPWDYPGNVYFNHIGGVTSGPGWVDPANRRVITNPAVGAGITANIVFNMRPTQTGPSEEQFQFEYAGVSWFGDKVASNSNMGTTVNVTQKAPWVTEGTANGGKKRGETVRFSVQGSDSWTDGNAYSWDFDGATTQGWRNGNACTLTQEDANDRLKVDWSGSMDALIYSSAGLALDTTKNNYCMIRMMHSPGSAYTAKLYWDNGKGITEASQYEFGVVADGQMHDYRLYMPNGVDWTGTVNLLRLNVCRNGQASGSCIIDFIRFYNEDAAGSLDGVIWLSTSQASWNIISGAIMPRDSATHNFYRDYTVEHGYPQTYYACMRVQNAATMQSQNHDRRFGGSGGGWGYRSYKVLNTPPTAANTSLSGNAWTNDATPTLGWSYSDADPNAQSNYRVQADDDSAFGSPALDTGYAAGSGTSFTPGSNLADDQWYYRVGVLDGISRNGTYSGGVGPGGPGIVTGDGHARFEGVNGHVVVPAFNESFGSGMTIEFWAYPYASTNYARFLDFGNGPGSDNIIVCRAGATDGLQFYVFDGATPSLVSVPGVLVNNEWHHYVVVLDIESTARVYRDGTLLGLGKVFMPNPVNRPSNYIGRSNWSADTYYQGALDEFAIYDRPLT